MKTFYLKNGLKVMVERKPAKTVAIEVNVATGSNNEEARVAGISHFLEHILFDGTKKRATALQISNEIERLGGEFNAATSNERTFFYIKVLSKHIDIALDILSDIILNPSFDAENVKKEKSIILDEINMVNDQPRYYQWILFQKSLFKKHPCRNPVYGSVKAISEISSKDLADYHKRYYMPANMTLVVAGGIGKGIESKIEKYFGGAAKAAKPKQPFITEPASTEKEVVREKRSINQSYVVLGYKTPFRSHKDSYTLDVIRAILGRGQSGRIFDEVRNKLGLAYDVGVYHNPNIDFGLFAVYASTNKKNINRIVEIVLREFKQLEKLSEKDLGEAKTFLEGEFLLHTEDNQKLADVLAFWDMANTHSSVDSYIKNIKKVTVQDVARAAKKYFTDNYTLAVVEQK
jgi:predicted Zn-dependent peptidase